MNTPSYLKQEKPWNEIKGNRPIDLITYKKCGAFKWRQLDDKDNCGDIEVWCRNLFDKTEHLVTLPYLYREGFDAWLRGEMISRAMPSLNSNTRETLINGMVD